MHQQVSRDWANFVRPRSCPIWEVQSISLAGGIPDLTEFNKFLRKSCIVSMICVGDIHSPCDAEAPMPVLARRGRWLCLRTARRAFFITEPATLATRQTRTRPQASAEHVIASPPTAVDSGKGGRVADGPCSFCLALATLRWYCLVLALPIVSSRSLSAVHRGGATNDVDGHGIPEARAWRLLPKSRSWELGIARNKLREHYRPRGGRNV